MLDVPELHFQFPLWDTAFKSRVFNIIFVGDFQFPLWDTTIFGAGLLSGSLFFQFPLWDTLVIL